MGVSPAIFESGGRRTEHYIPGVYSRSNTVSNPSGVNASNHVVLGKSTGGKPFELLGFASLADAKNVLVGGELLNAIAYAFNGSDTYIPQTVYAMRVNDGKQSELTLKSGGSTPILKLTSWDWGFHTNQLKLWLQEGTEEGSKKLTIAYKDDESTVDNIIRPSISLTYTGEGSTPTASVTATGIELAAGEVDVFSFNFEDYSTLESLVSRINDTGVYVASLLDTTLNTPSVELDTVSSVSITENATLYSNLSALIKVLKESIYIGGVEILSESSRVVPDVTTGYEYFTGGTVGEYTVAEWTKALEALETKDVQIISTPSNDISVQNLIAAHCTFMNSTENKKERTCILGGALNETNETAITNAKAFNSKLCSYVVDNAQVVNPITGEAEVIPGSVLAVMLAGMESGMAINEPLTNKSVKVLGFTKSRTRPDIVELVKNGVLVCNPSPDEPNRNVVIRGLTTYQGDDLILNEISMVREDIYMNRDLRKRLNPGIGRPMVTSTSDVVKTLLDAAAEWKTSGLIIPNDKNEYVWNIKVRVDGDKRYLDFDRYLTAPTNFQFFTVTNRVYKTSLPMGA